MVLLGCVHLMGGPIAALQLVAWSGMLVTYSAEVGLSQGVTDTFSGKKPCALCLQVREMERDAPSPALPGGDEQRRVAEAFGQSLRVTELLELPEPSHASLAWHGRSIMEMNRPEDPGIGPETPPPKRSA